MARRSGTGGWRSQTQFEAHLSGSAPLPERLPSVLHLRCMTRFRYFRVMPFRASKYFFQSGYDLFNCANETT